MNNHIQHRLSTLVIILGILMIPTSFVFAHGSGKSLEKQVGDTLVDIEYNPEILTDDTSSLFNFDLRDNKGGDVPFTDVWVRILKGKATVFATGVYKSDLGGAILTYKFAHTGPYELSVRYENGTQTVAETSFPLNIAAGETTTSHKQNSWPSIIISFLAGLIVAGGGVWIKLRRGSNKISTE